MREILFRGKDIKNNVWEYGDLLRNANGKSFIRKAYKGIDVFTEVNPDTVGQYTEQKDLNGDKIFEGDILMRDNDREDLLVVWWNDEMSSFCVVEDDFMHEADYIHRLELFSNKYDEPELLDIRNPKDDDEE